MKKPVIKDIWMLLDTESITMAFDVHVELFNQVRLGINMCKMVSMTCQPFHMPGRMSVGMYKRR